MNTKCMFGVSKGLNDFVLAFLLLCPLRLCLLSIFSFYKTFKSIDVISNAMDLKCKLSKWQAYT